MTDIVSLFGIILSLVLLMALAYRGIASWRCRPAASTDSPTRTWGW